ncbi:MAG: FHA domain-containing protein [Cyanobacteria bacterium P01_F01_bin.42]
MSYPEPVITLTLLHPVQGTAVQSWSFQNDQRVRIGRAVDNEVVLYSAVVSRHHVEVCYQRSCWYVNSLGVNGTFLDGKKIESEPLESGQTIRLARSGPNIKVSIDATVADASGVDVVTPPSRLRAASGLSGTQGMQMDMAAEVFQEKSQGESEASAPSSSAKKCDCSRSPKSSLICIYCGEPMNVLRSVGNYKILKCLDDRNTTFQAWKNKKTYVLRTAPAQILETPELKQTFLAQLQRAEALNHGGIPRMIEVLETDSEVYLVYEMVYGISLYRWVTDRGVLPLPSAISWITEVAHTVEYLHQLEPPFIHHGINPNTIIRLTIPNGGNSLMLVNFGQFDHLFSFFNPSNATLAYRPPQRKPGETSVDLDLVSLGATFLFMLTGADPYKFMKLDDSAFTLEVDDSYGLSPAAFNLIGSLLRTQNASPVTTVTEAINKFSHLI